MRDLQIEKQKKEFYTFPEISLNGASGVCEIGGESFMENAKEFYTPVFEWLNEYQEETGGGNLKFEISPCLTTSS